MKPVIALMVISLLYGVTLLWWHRKLMLYLSQTHPTVWDQLGPRVLARRIWPYSTIYPIWSWKSLLFFLARKYRHLRDVPFAHRARRFRLALLGWLVLCVVLTVGALYWQAHFGS